MLDPDREQWQQLKAVLTTALEASASERPAVVRRMLGHDPPLLECALDMLQYYETATRRFDTGGDTDIVRDPFDRASAPARVAAPGGVEIKAGDSVGVYRVIRKLGEGGMGTIFLAEDERLGRRVALKFLSRTAPALVSNPRARLLSESRSAALLNHSAIVTLHDVFDYEGELVAVMEYVEGRPLDQAIGGQPLPLAFALRLVSQLADALGYAHGRGILHCDLKPANVHLLPNGSPKILDFGLARVLADADSIAEADETRLFGTPGYLAPERLLGGEPGAAADVYALGVIFYELLTGAPPFRSGNQRQLLLDTITAQPAPPSSLVRGIPAAVDELVLRCLAKSPRDRLQPHELVRAITGVLLQIETSPVVADRIGPQAADAADTRAASRSRALRATAVVLILLIAAAVGSGLITTWTFDVVTERSGFAAESFAQRTVIGLRSMVYPAVIVSLTLAVVSFGGYTIRAIAAARQNGVPVAVRIVSPAAAVFVFFGLAIAAVAILLAGFGEYISALNARLGSAAPDVLAPLAPDNLQQQALYRTVSSMLVAVLLAAWNAMRTGESRQRLPIEIRAGALGLIVVIAVLAQAPYKLTVYNAVPVALVDGVRCYVVGERADAVRTYCPASEVPRVRTVSRAVTAIQPCGFDENVFRQRDGSTCQADR